MGDVVFTDSDVVRELNKTLDVLYRVKDMLTSEANMNAAKHMATIVRPTPLASAVSNIIADLEAWRERERSGP